MPRLAHSLLADSGNPLSTGVRVRRKIEVEEDLRKSLQPPDSPASLPIPDSSRLLTPGLAADARTSQPPESTLLLAVSPHKEDLAFLTQTFRETHWRLCEAHTYREALTILCHDRMPAVICRSCLPDGTWKDVLSQTAVLPDPPRLLVACKEPRDQLWAEVINLGGYDVLTVPFDRNELIWAVGRAWQNWEYDTRRAHERWRERKIFASSV